MPPKRAAQPQAKQRSRLRKPRDEADRLLQAQAEKGTRLAGRGVTGPSDLESLESEYFTWDEFNYTLIESLFTTDQEALAYRGIVVAMGWGGVEELLGAQLQELREKIQSKVRRLESVRQRLELYDLSEEAETLQAASGAADHRTTALRASARPGDRPVDSKRVFIIHGRAADQALTLQKLLRDEFSLEGIILSWEPGKGRALVEKLEDEAGDCAYAFAIFTRDDVVKAPKGDYYQMRPNAVFELGWFYGRKGRKHACILLKEGTVVPSDLQGINYHGFTQSVQQVFYEIKRELKAAELAT